MFYTIGILRRAIEECQKSNYYPYKVGCVLFNKKVIISSGHNSKRSNSIHPKYKCYPNSFCAEQSALIGINWSEIKNFSLLVIRIGKSGKFCMAKPCQKCTQLIKYIELKDVYYSNRDGEIVKIKVKDL